MALIYSIGGKTPRIHSTAFIAPDAVIIGDVTIGAYSSVFYGCVLRGDLHEIIVGENTNIQDLSCFHVDRNAPVHLGNDVTIGHRALVHGATVGDGTLIGMGATLLSGSRVGTGSLIAAGAVLLEGQTIGDRKLAAGIPAKEKRDLTNKQSAALIPHAKRYVEVAQLHKMDAVAVPVSEVVFE